MAVQLTDKVKQELQGVIELMERNIGKIDMSSWVDNSELPIPGESHSCNTTACLAGYICLYHGYTPRQIECITWSHPSSVSHVSDKTIPPYVRSAGELAMCLMGFPLAEGDGISPGLKKLFLLENWPEPFISQYTELYEYSEDAFLEIAPKPNRAKAGHIAINRLKYFIETGE